MTRESPDRSPVRDGQRSDEYGNAPPPGQMGVVLTGLAIGVLLMGVQLWLLTVALELYLSGEGSRVWQAALISGVIFLGGLGMLWLIRRRPRVKRTSAG